MPDDMAYDVGAVVSFLLNDATVAALVGGRVFGNEMPAAEAVSMPRKALVVNSVGNGNYWATGNVPVDSRMMDIRAYGETPYEARRLWNAANLALKNMRRRLVAPPSGLGSVLLYSANKVGGPTARREPDSEWPVAFGTYNVMVADTVA